MSKKIIILIFVIFALIPIVYNNWQPSVINYEPNCQLTDNTVPIKITYKRDVIPESVISNLSITPATEFTWKYEVNTITITPIDKWKRNQDYHIKINKGVLAKLGIRSKTCFEWSFEVAPAESIDITLLGDILLDDLPSAFASSDDPHYAFNMLDKDLMLNNNLIIANLECPISDRGSEIANKSYRFRAGQEALGVLQAGNIDAVILANNHALDYGPQALTDTVTNCTAASITTVGYGAQGAESVQPTIIEHEGYKIGIVAYLDEKIIPYHHRELWQGVDGNAGVRFIDSDIYDEVKALHDKVDIVIVALHWGIERSHTVTAEQRLLAEQLIDNGADIIMGHHPHVPQAVEHYKDGIIFYSLGNFIFPPTNEHLRDTFATTVRINKDSIKSITLFPIKPVNGRPHAMNATEAQGFIKRLQKWSREFNTTLTIDNNKATVD